MAADACRVTFPFSPHSEKEAMPPTVDDKVPGIAEIRARCLEWIVGVTCPYPSSRRSAMVSARTLGQAKRKSPGGDRIGVETEPQAPSGDTRTAKRIALGFFSRERQPPGVLATVRLQVFGGSSLISSS